MRVVLALTLLVSTAAPAFAQRLPFERTFDVTGASRLDVETIRGKIDVTVGAPGKIVVNGTVTVRVGLNVPSNAVELARKVAEHPPIQRDGKIIRLRPPSDPSEERAVTVAYQVQVPPDTEVSTSSDSGATTIRDVSAPVVVRTQSAAIELNRLGSTATVTTASGSILIDGVASTLAVSTNSSALTARAVQGALNARTQSGAIDVVLTGTGAVNVETESSAIRLRGVRGDLTASTQSGRITVSGLPHGVWDVTTGSSAVDLTLDRGTSAELDLQTRSGSVSVEGAVVNGVVSKRTATGTIAGGGAKLKVTTGSGAITVNVAMRQ